MARSLRIFISSPGDVNSERLRAALVIEKLAKDYSRFFDIGFLLWESEPMLASGHFQDNILAPHEADILVLILWSRLGSPLPERTELREYRGIDGRAPVTGTEWEFEDALASQKTRGLPDLLAYRKDTPPEATYRSAADLEQLASQLRALELFWRRHFVEFKAAFRTFADLDAFESQLEGDLRRLIERRIAARHGETSNSEPAVWLKGSPFRGLEAYHFEHAPIFFGRSEASKRAIEQLVANAESKRPFLLILGASGSGKSSLVQAGIFPGLFARGVVSGVGLWRRAAMRPGGHPKGPFYALAEALLSETALPELASNCDVAALVRHLLAAVDDAGYPIAMALRAREADARTKKEVLPHEEARLALSLDQLEELFTIGEIEVNQRTKFIACVRGLLRSGRVFVVASMRSDYWHRASEAPALIEMAQGANRFDLMLPTPAEIAEAIRRPAEAAGIAFETHPRTEVHLDAALAEEAASQPGALPLLSFLLDAIYTRDIVSGGQLLTYASMAALGGLKGAIAHRAEAVFAELPSEVQAVFPRVLRALVTVSRVGADPTSRVAALTNFAEGSPERRLVAALLSASVRLLLADGDGEEARVRLAHEAMITHWDRARRQIAQDRDDLRNRASIEEAEAQWRMAQPGQSRSYLLRDPQLANAVDLARRWGGELEPELRAFISRSEAAAKAASRRRWAFAVVLMTCLALLALASVGGFYVAETQRNQALSDQSRYLATYGRLFSDNGDAALGSLLALAALPRHLAKPDRPFVPVAGYALEDAAMNWRQRAILRGHEKGVHDAVFSPDGRRVLTASMDGTARIWDAEKGTLLAVLSGGAESGPVSAVVRVHGIFSAAFSPDGKRALTALEDGPAVLWDAETGKRIAVEKSPDVGLFDAAFSPSGDRFVTAAASGVVRIWDSETGAELAVLKGHEGAVFKAAFSPDGKRILTASQDKTARLWDAETGTQQNVLRLHTGTVWSAAFSHDGKRVITASGDRRAIVWDAETGKALTILPHDNAVLSAAFSPDGRSTVTGTLGGITRVSNQFGRIVALFKGHEGPVWAVSFSPDGKQVLSAYEDGLAEIWSAESGAVAAVLEHAGKVSSVQFSKDGTRLVTASADGAAKEWLADSGVLAATLRGHSGPVNAAAFSPDGKRLATASDDKTARVWDAGSGEQLLLLEGHSDKVLFVAFSPAGDRVLTGSADGTARLWDGRNGDQLQSFDRSNRNPLSSVSFSPDGAHVLVAAGNQALLWDVAAGKPANWSLDHLGKIEMAAFSADGRQIITASADKTAAIWDATTGAQLAPLAGHQDLVMIAAFSPDGLRAATGDLGGQVRLWNARTGALIAAVRPSIDAIGTLAFSPDGKRLLVGGNDIAPSILDGETGAEVGVLRGHLAGVTAGSFSPSGQRVATGSVDNTAILWQMPLRCQELIDAMRRRGLRDLSPAERRTYFIEGPPEGFLFRLYADLLPYFAWALPSAGASCV